MSEVLDVTQIPHFQRHATIFERFTSLKVGEFFILKNDHDPVPLHHQFDAHFPGTFTWDYQVRTPGDFQIKISKSA